MGFLIRALIGLFGAGAIDDMAFGGAGRDLLLEGASNVVEGGAQAGVDAATNVSQDTVNDIMNKYGWGGALGLGAGMLFGGGGIAQRMMIGVALAAIFSWVQSNWLYTEFNGAANEAAAAPRPGVDKDGYMNPEDPVWASQLGGESTDTPDMDPDDPDLAHELE